METFMLVDSPVLSAVIWLLLIISALYLARSSARRAIMALARTGHSLSRRQAQHRNTCAHWDSVLCHSTARWPQ